jgi:iron complex outermembrane receptor protein
MTTYNRLLIDTTVVREEISGTVGLVLTPGLGLRVKANYGRSYRVPSLMELFGYRGMTVPSPGLEPETGLNRDVGVGWEFESEGARYITAEFAYFWSDVEDLIMFVYVPFAQAAQAINIDSADIEGYECSISCGTWHGLALDANLTHLTAINTGPVSYMTGKHLPNRPRDEASVAVRWSYRGVQAFYEFDYIAENYLNANNGVGPNNKGPLFDTRRLHAAGVGVPTGIPHTDFSIEIRNITDERYEDVMGFPLPGRSVSATLMVSL